MLLWATFVYDPIAHWVWGVGGFLRKMGALDFAGGAVVHINAGMTALAAALILRKRQGYPCSISPPHNLPFAVLGAALLWFGWFGFNAGSALKASGSGRQCVHRNTHSRCRCRCNVGYARLAQVQKANDIRYDYRCSGRPGSHYPSIRIRYACGGQYG